MYRRFEVGRHPWGSLSQSPQGWVLPNPRSVSSLWANCWRVPSSSQWGKKGFYYFPCISVCAHYEDVGKKISSTKLEQLIQKPERQKIGPSQNFRILFPNFLKLLASYRLEIIQSIARFILKDSVIWSKEMWFLLPKIPPGFIYIYRELRVCDNFSYW